MPILEVTLDDEVLRKFKVYLRMALQMSMRDIMDAADDHWKRLARQGLHETQQAYVAGIQPVEIKGLVGRIALAGELPNMIEHGADEYNLQDVMLKGGGTRVIAFRFAAPGSRGTDVGQRMTKVFAPKGPRSLSQTRRFKSLRQAQQLGKKVHALAMTGKVTDSGIKQMMPKVPHTKLSEKHAVGAFEGMRREGARGHAQYKTFRTMTDERDKWIHPGFEPRNFMEQTADYIEEIAPAAFQTYVEGLFP
jgi:hypothetical protein